MTVATVFTLIRIFAIPVFVLAFYWPHASAHFWAALIFGLAALTDWLDGYLARRLNQESSLGKFLDPVADKLIVAVALIVLLQQHPTVLFALAVSIVICREITVSALRERMADMGLSDAVSVSWQGKLKTTFQMIAILLLVWDAGDFAFFSMYDAGLILFYIAVGLTVVSMVSYLINAIPRLLENEK